MCVHVLLENSIYNSIRLTFLFPRITQLSYFAYFIDTQQHKATDSGSRSREEYPMQTNSTSDIMWNARAENNGLALEYQ